MATVISITSGKGGAGKSSVATGLGVAYARRRKRVVIVELDLGLRCVDIMLGMENQIVYDLGDVLSSRCELQDAIVQSDRYPGLFYLASPVDISVSIDFQLLAKQMEPLRRLYDVIILDTPAGLGMGILAMEYLSDFGIIVTTPDPVCIRDGAKVAALAEQGGFHQYKLVINRVSKAAIKKSSITDLDAVLDGVGAMLLGVIPEDSDYQILQTKGCMPEEEHRISMIYDAISRRIDGDYRSLILNRL
jgi:septum site-determining protein MinD